jgi:PKD repeat protein
MKFKLLIVVLLCLFVLPALAITNPGFETGDLTGWSAVSDEGCSAEVVSTEHHNGTYSAQLIAVLGLASLSTTTEQGTSFSIWYKIPDISFSHMYITVSSSYTDDEDNYHTTQVQAYLNEYTPDWTEVVLDTTSLYTEDPEWEVLIEAGNYEEGDIEAYVDDAAMSGETLPPVADFVTNATNGYPAFNILFTDDSTHTPTSWYWEFGDGNTSTDQNPVHTYDDVIGNNHVHYSVNHSATNDGGVDWENKTDLITAWPLNCNFTTNVTSGNAPLWVGFTDVTLNGTATAWNWSFGDGNYSNDQNPVHEYTSVGSYDVSLNSSNSYSYDIYTVINKITVSAMTTDFTANTTSGNPTLYVQFSDTSTDSPTSWYWEFGDGGTSTDEDPIHDYTYTGLFSVNHSSTNTYGTDWENKTDYISVEDVPVVDFTSNVTTGGGWVQFTDTSEDSPIFWYWDFGDGSTSTIRNPSHLYSAPCGDYTVKHKAGIPGSWEDWENKTDYIHITSLVAEFSANVTSGNPPLTVSFTNTSTSYADSWIWEFGDGNTSTDENPVHTYYSNGIFSVNLSISDGTCIGIKNKTNYIFTEPLSIISWNNETYYLGDTATISYSINNSVWASISAPIIKVTTASDPYAIIEIFPISNQTDSFVTTLVPALYGLGSYRAALCSGITTDWEYDTRSEISSVLSNDSQLCFMHLSLLTGFWMESIYPSGVYNWEYSGDFGSFGSPGSRYKIDADSNHNLYATLGYGDYYIYSVHPDGTLNWKYALSGVFPDDVVVSQIDEMIYVDDSLYLYAFFPNGSLKWQYLANGNIPIPVIDSSNNIYMAYQYPTGGGTYTFERYLASVDSNGNFRWNVSNNYFTVNEIAYKDPYLYVVGLTPDDPFAANLYLVISKVDTSGNYIWTYNTSVVSSPSNYLKYPAVDDYGSIYLTSREATGDVVYAIDSDGNLKWAYPASISCTVNPTVNGNHVYISDGQYLLSLDLYGNLEWSYNAIYPITNLVDIDGDRIYLPTGDDSSAEYWLRALNTSNSAVVTYAYDDMEIILPNYTILAWDDMNITILNATVPLFPPHSVRFVLVDYFGNPLPDVAVYATPIQTTLSSWAWLGGLFGMNITETNYVNTTMNGTTGLDGSIDFIMYATIKYNVTCVGGAHSVNYQTAIYPQESEILLYIPIGAPVTSNMTYTTPNQTFTPVELGGVPGMNQWLALGTLLLVGTIFTKKSVKIAMVVVPLFSMFFLYLGWLSMNVMGLTILVSLLILGILSYARKSERTMGT